MEVLTRYQAKELGERGITANIIAPGAIETDFSGGNVRDNAQLNAYIASQTALGVLGYRMILATPLLRCSAMSWPG